MKILDRYILSTYLRTFFSVFIIFMFIFVLQGLWLYISELAGKDLDGLTTVKFIIYSSPRLIPLVVPLTVLLSSIMVFGNFAENYEFAAMKSTGISLQRAMRSVILFIVFLGFGCFFFANNAIPWGEYKFVNLRQNIAKLKPAMAIVEGQFNEIGTINIKVDEKYGNRDQFLKNVVIYKTKKLKRGNYNVIIAETGELKSDKNSNILKIELKNGNYYDELIGKDVRKFNDRKPHAQSTFDTYTINYDISSLYNVDLDQKSSDDRYNMLDVSSLSYTIDSLFAKRGDDYKSLSKNLYNRTTYKTLNTSITLPKDSIFEGEILDLFDTNKAIQAINSATNTTNSTTQVLQSNKKKFEAKTKHRNRHIIALHEKYTLGFACLILFFVGAPLGALIRKGGIGLPVVVGILLFLTYHFIGIAIKNNAKADAINPVLGTWLSTLIMLPLSIYLTYTATRDRGVLQLDVITVPLKKLFSFKSQLNDIRSVQSYSYYNKHAIEDLIDIVKQHDDFTIDKKPKQIALQHLSDRNISLEELESRGLQVPQSLKNAKSQLKNYLDYATTCLVSFCTGAVFLALYMILKKSERLSLDVITALKSLSIIAFGIFGLYVIVSSVYYSKCYQSIRQSKKRINPIFILLSLPVYPIRYALLKLKIKEDFQLSYLEQIK